MKIQKLLLLLLVMAFASACFMLCGFGSDKNKVETSPIKVENSLQNYSQIQSNLWCVTFQLVWNEFMDKITDGKPVVFEGGNPTIADELNKKAYTKDILSEKSYYIAEGKISKSLKRKIEKQIKKQFDEKSDILDLINWNVKNSYLFYAMLKKEFTFEKAFDKFPVSSFNSSTENVKYFGINEKSDKKLKKNVDVLFYNSPDEYAIKLLTKQNEDVILFRTDKTDSFENLFEYVAENTKFDDFSSKDNLKVPLLSVDKTVSYDDLTGKKIKGTKYVISQALQTIKFKLDEKGGSLKSEAAITVMKMSLAPEDNKQRNFFFDKPFILFLMENGQDKPYYAMKVDSIDYLVKEELK